MNLSDLPPKTIFVQCYNEQYPNIPFSHVFKFQGGLGELLLLDLEEIETPNRAIPLSHLEYLAIIEE